MRRIFARFALRLVSDKQKQQSVFVRQQLLDDAQNDQNLLSRVITRQKTSVYFYDPETKQQSHLWESPSAARPKKARQVQAQHQKLVDNIVTVRLLFITNLFFWARQLTSIATGRFSIV
jgi:hypothetical protein